MWEKNCFITLTYNDEHLPRNNDLDYTDFQKFMKRLRKKYRHRKIRFFMCGEYGENYGRPHFHACLFNLDFDDRVYLKTSASGSKIFTSSTLESLWSDKNGNPIGFATVGDVNFDSAGYVARYVMKKRQGKRCGNEYTVVDLETGETYERQQEFVHMSLKNGIGYEFYKKWRTDIFPHDYCIVDGVKMKPPKYYTKKLAEEYPFDHNIVQTDRAIKALGLKADSTPDRLEVKEKILKARSKLLKRELI